MTAASAQPAPLPDEAFAGGYDEAETIAQSLVAQLRRHVDWYADGVRARLDREHGAPLANAHHHWIRVESMRRVGAMARDALARLDKAAQADAVEF
jgi:hypothetical protein